MATVSWSTVTAQPRLRSTSAIRGTSRISGQLVIVVVPSASSAAAMSLRTLFFAPTTSTDPTSRAPPRTAKCSTTADDASAWHPPFPSGHRRAVYRCGPIPLRRGRAPHQDLHEDRRRRHHRARRLLPRPQDRRPARGLRRHRRVQRGDRRGRDGRRPGRGGARTAAPGAERPVRRGCGPVQPHLRRPEVPAAAGDRRVRHTTRGLVRRASTRACRSSTRSSCPAAPPALRTCTWRGRSPAAPSGPCGRCWTTTPSAPTR